MTPDEIKNRLERILLKVQRPGRYVGGEYNQVVKMWEQVQTRVALIFPDIYDLGIANLGLAILYEEINRRSDALAERVYSPWTDMEQELRQAGIPLFSLESKHALTDFDILAITLPYETLYTNVLNLLDLAGIPLYASDRSQRYPLVIAGGQAAFNPEPMTDFIDAFVIGEGEDVIHEVLDVQLRWKRSGDPRAKLLANLSQIPGVYVPSLYQPHYHADGTLAGIDKLVDQAPLPIVKRIVPTLPPPPERFIVPSINVVHNRVAIEIMRGCTRGCRFCHAGMVNRPVRERPVDQIVEAIEKALESTGYEEVALLSLSSSDYTHILPLVEAISQKFQGKNLSISLPSLRIESFSVDLLERLKGARQGGFTLAPEAGTDRMRSIINKPIPSQQLLEIARQIYSRNWKTIKLYFLIGHPSETLEDVQAIAELCQAVIAEGRKVIGKRASLHIGVSTFVPKPHTPFQWVACDTVEQITAKHNLLKKSLRGAGLKLTWTDTQDTLLEAWLCRGDRRLNEVIYRAWKHGARFDAWQEKKNSEAWQAAFIEAGIDPHFYTHRVRPLDERLPWEHISAGVSQRFLKQDYLASQQGELRPDCRQLCAACGILPLFNELRSQSPGSEWKCPEKQPEVPAATKEAA